MKRFWYKTSIRNKLLEIETEEKIGRGFGKDLELQTEQPKIGKDLRMHFSKRRNNFNAVRL